MSRFARRGREATSLDKAGQLVVGGGRCIDARPSHATHHDPCRATDNGRRDRTDDRTRRARPRRRPSANSHRLARPTGRRQRATGHAIGGAPGQARALCSASGEEVRRARLVSTTPALAGRTRAHCSGCPRRRRCPIAWWIAMGLRVFDGRSRWFGAGAVVRIRPTQLRGDKGCRSRRLNGRAVVSGRRRRHSSRRRRLNGRAVVSTSCMRRLAARPVLERRTDRERARQAVRLLVRQGAGSRCRFGKAPMAMVGTRRPRLAIVLERDERTGRCTIHAG